MSRARVWAVVEGSNHDVPFYEGLLTDGAGITTVEFVSADDIEVGGVAAGGKLHALKIYETLNAVGGLRQENKATKVDVVFFLDRDDDDYLGLLVESEHVQYTHFSDVEAEIVMHSDLARAVARAFSVSRLDAVAHTPEQPDSDLAARWAEWIALRLASGECKWSDTRFAQPSSINVPRYGGVDVTRIDPICERVRRASPEWDEALERARAHVAGASFRGDSGRLIKGKWLPAFIVHLITQSFGSGRSLPRVGSAHLVTACLMTIDFRAVWHKRYAGNLQPVLDR